MASKNSLEYQIVNIMSELMENYVNNENLFISTLKRDFVYYALSDFGVVGYFRNKGKWSSDALLLKLFDLLLLHYNIKDSDMESLVFVVQQLYDEDKSIKCLYPIFEKMLDYAIDVAYNNGIISKK